MTGSTPGAHVERSIEAIEAEFQARRCHAPRVDAAFAEAMAEVGLPARTGRLAPGTPERTQILYQAGLRVVAAASVPHSPSEPAYHDRHHTCEAVLAMGWLCRAAQQLGLLSGHDAAVGVVAMAGHDLHHDGSVLQGGVLEARSRDAVQALAADLDPRDRGLVGSVIIATNPACVAANAARPAEPGRPVQDILHRLANEADVFASLLPSLGVRLSLLLAEEWQAAGDPDLLRVGTAGGRLRFLRGYPALSGPATVLGLEAARQRGIRAYTAAAGLLRAGATAEAGCDALDRLPRAEADAAYRAALSRVPH